jgi:hypothetical protein
MKRLNVENSFCVEVKDRTTLYVWGLIPAVKALYDMSWVLTEKLTSTPP